MFSNRLLNDRGDRKIINKFDTVYNKYAINYLNLLGSIAKEKGKELIVITEPISAYKSVYINRELLQAQLIDNIIVLKSAGNNETSVFPKNMWADRGHLNLMGNIKYTNYLYKILSEYEGLN